MRSRHFIPVLVGVAAFASLVSSAYYGSEQGSCYPQPETIIDVEFPLDTNYFPYTQPGSDNDTQIAEPAGGIRPNLPLPTSISRNTLITLQILALSFYYAVAYYTQVLNYIVAGRPGYYIPDSQEREYTISALQSIIAQEEQHGINAYLGVLNYGGINFQPCKYYYPATVRDYTSAFLAAASSADQFVGLFQVIIQQLAEDGDAEIIQQFVSVAQSEAEHAGWFRSVNGYPPAANPFPPPFSREDALSLLNQAIVPGSCPGGAAIDLQSFPPLTVVQQPLPSSGVDQVIQLSIQASIPNALSATHVGYVNQQNKPLVVPIQSQQNSDGCIIITAVFPTSLLTFGSGLTIIHLLNRAGNYTDINSMTRDTVAAPGITYID